MHGVTLLRALQFLKRQYVAALGLAVRNSHLVLIKNTIELECNTLCQVDNLHSALFLLSYNICSCKKKKMMVMMHFLIVCF